MEQNVRHCAVKPVLIDHPGEGFAASPMVLCLGERGPRLGNPALVRQQVGKVVAGGAVVIDASAKRIASVRLWPLQSGTSSSKTRRSSSR